MIQVIWDLGDDPQGNLQHIAERELRDAVSRNKAAAGTVIVMDPHSGDILAMASYPWFDPNDFEHAKPGTLRNRAITDAFEPGSTNKVITASAAIEPRVSRLIDLAKAAPAQSTAEAAPIIAAKTEKPPIPTAEPVKNSAAPAIVQRTQQAKPAPDFIRQAPTEFEQRPKRPDIPPPARPSGAPVPAPGPRRGAS